MSDEKQVPEEAKEELTAPKATEDTTTETPVEAPAEEATEAPAEEAPATAPVEPAIEPNKEEKEVESTDIPQVEEDAVAEELPNSDLKTGMVVRVHERIQEGSKERIQVFEGMIIGIKGADVSRTMTVRKNSKGWMVEKIFPLSSPKLEKVEVVKEFRVRRAKINYVRGKFKRKFREIKKETK